MPEITGEFINESRELLTSKYLPKIEEYLEGLTDEDVWWNPNSESDSIGNLLLQLDDCVRKWIIEGIGELQTYDHEHYGYEANWGISSSELIERLRRTIAEADTILTNFEAEQLSKRKQFQGQNLNAMQMIYNAVNCFSMKTGQVFLIAKMRTDDSPGS